MRIHGCAFTAAHSRLRIHGCAFTAAHSRLERFCMEGEVVGHECRDEVVGVIVPLLHPQRELDPLGLARSLQAGWQQLIYL
jgi:hypothetical protein